MARGKKHTPEQIVSLLRQIEVAIANGKSVSNLALIVQTLPLLVLLVLVNVYILFKIPSMTHSLFGGGGGGGLGMIAMAVRAMV